MTRKLSRAALVVATSAAVLVGSNVGRSADEKYDSIEKIMKLAHNKTKGIGTKLGAEIKAGQWDDAKKDADKMKVLGEALVLLKPEKDDKGTWKALSEKYKTSTAAVADAVDKKDTKAANAALGALGKSCKECHDAHR